MRPLVLFTVLLLSLNCVAQTRTITGRVFDKEENTAIKNVNVTIEGTTSRSKTNHLGYFQLNIEPTDSVLVVSHVSYVSIAVAIPKVDFFRIDLEEGFIVLPKMAPYVTPPKIPDYDNLSNRGAITPVSAGEENASFIGGAEYLINFLGLNYKYPQELKKLIQGVAHISFAIDEMGVVAEVESKTDSLDQAMSDELVRLFSSMPAWMPAKQYGEPVAQKFLASVVYAPRLAKYDSSTYLNYYLESKLSYPREAIRLAVEGTVYLYFELDYRQEFRKMKAIQGVGSGCDSTVYSLVRSTPKAELKKLMADVGDSVFVLAVDFRLNNGQTKIDKQLVQAEAVYLNTYLVVASNSKNPYQSMDLDLIDLASEFYSIEGALKNSRIAKRLIMVNQRLDSIPPSIGSLMSLQLLDLENNNLEYIPPEIGLLIKLEEFYAPKNKLMNLPAGIVNLAKLKVVGLAYNNFDTFPQKLISNRNLTAIDLSNNKLNSIPEEIGQLKKLKILLLRNNKLTSLPESIFELKLKELDLQGNSLSDEMKSRISATFKNAKITL